MTDGQIKFALDKEEPQTHFSEAGFSRIFEFGITESLLNKELIAEIAQYKEEISMPGFRKGKVPLSLFVRRLPEEERRSFLERMVAKQIDMHIKDSDKIVIGTPNIDSDYSAESGLAAKVKMTYEVCPAIPEIDYSQYELVKYVPLDRAQLLEQIREDFLKANPEQVLQESGYKSEIGDSIKFDLRIEAPDTSADGFIDRGRDVIVSEDSSLFGTEFNSIGLEAGEEFAVDTKLPDFDAQYEHSGESCVFHFKAVEVYKNKILDEPTIEMAKKYGFNSIEELDATLLERKLAQFENISTGIFKEQFILTIGKELNFDVPDRILNETMENIWYEREDARARNKDDGKAKDSQEDSQTTSDNDLSSKEEQKTDTASGEGGVVEDKRDENQGVDQEGRSTEGKHEEVQGKNSSEEKLTEDHESEKKDLDWDKIDPEEVSEINDIAVKKLRYTVLLKHVAKNEDIKASREEIVEDWAGYINNIYQNQKIPNQDILRFENIPDYYVINAQNRIVSAKVENLLMDNVSAKEIKIDFEKLVEIRKKMTPENILDLVHSEDEH